MVYVFLDRSMGSQTLFTPHFAFGLQYLELKSYVIPFLFGTLVSTSAFTGSIGSRDTDAAQQGYVILIFQSA